MPSVWDSLIDTRLNPILLILTKTACHLNSCSSKEPSKMQTYYLTSLFYPTYYPSPIIFFDNGYLCRVCWRTYILGIFLLFLFWLDTVYIFVHWVSNSIAQELRTLILLLSTLNPLSLKSLLWDTCKGILIMQLNAKLNVKIYKMVR